MSDKIFNYHDRVDPKTLPDLPEVQRMGILVNRMLDWIIEHDGSELPPTAVDALTTAPNAYHLSREELIILTPFYDDHSPLPLAPCYRAVIRSRDIGEIPKEYCFRSPFSLRKELQGIEEKFGMDLTDHVIIFCVKRKGTKNNWRGKIDHIITEQSDYDQTTNH